MSKDYTTLHGDIVSARHRCILFVTYDKPKKTLLIPEVHIENGHLLEEDTEIHINVETDWCKRHGCG